MNNAKKYFHTMLYKCKPFVSRAEVECKPYHFTFHNYSIIHKMLFKMDW